MSPPSAFSRGLHCEVVRHVNLIQIDGVSQIDIITSNLTTFKKIMADQNLMIFMKVEQTAINVEVVRQFGSD